MGTDWFELFIIGVSLIITLCIGLYFSGSGKKSLQEYMLGGRTMSVLPISLSIAATYLSGSSIMSTSQEVYFYGMQVATAGLWFIIWGLIAAWVFVPVSYNIKSVSSFEYFSRRFNPHMRRFASLIYLIEIILHTAVSQFIPALSLSQATGYPIFSIACTLALISFVYTVAGGLKAVAYADSFQAILIFVCALVLILVGGWTVGGPTEIYHKGVEGARWEFFDFNPSLEARYNLLHFLFGSFLRVSIIYLAPSYHQRIVSLPTFEKAQKVIILSSIFAGIFLMSTYSMGLIVYAYFAGCDPVLAKKNIKSHATIAPYFVGEISKSIPGLTGLFQAGIIAAGLSTTTSCWNTVACTLFEDFVRPALYQEREVPRKRAFQILAGIIVTISIISTSLVNVMSSLGTSLLEVTSSLKSTTSSVTFVLYYSGMFLPWVNCKGAIVGSVVATGITTYIYLGAQNARNLKLVVNLPKILTTADCPVNATTMAALNLTTTIGTTGFGLRTVADQNLPIWFRMSMNEYSVPGSFIGLFLSLLVSWLTGSQNLSTVDRETISPLMRWVLPESKNVAGELEELQELKGKKPDDKMEHENRENKTVV